MSEPRLTSWNKGPAPASPFYVIMLINILSPLCSALIMVVCQ